MIGLTHGGTGRDDVVDDQYPALQWRADDAAAFAVRLLFLAVVAPGHIDVVLLGERGGRQGRERDAFVRGTEDHVEFDIGGRDGCRIEAADSCCSVAGVEKPCVEEIRADAAGLQGELPEPQHAEFQRQVDKFLLVGSHLLRPAPRFCIMAASGRGVAEYATRSE